MRIFRIYGILDVDWALIELVLVIFGEGGGCEFSGCMLWLFVTWSSRFAAVGMEAA